MNRANAPRLIAPPVQIASNQTPATPETAPLAMKLEPKENVKAKVLGRMARSRTAAAPQLATSAAAPQLMTPARTAQLESSRTFMTSFRAAAPAPIPEAVRRQFSAGFPANAPFYQGPLVRYSLVRSGPAGDGLRVEVTTGMAGYLALYQVDTGGNSKRVYPVEQPADQPTNEPAVRVMAGQTIQIPNSPIKLADVGNRLRLVLVPAVPSNTIGQLGGAVNGAVLGTGPAPLPAPATPLVIDIPLAPN
jgi:hypothetical protein